MYLTVIRMEQHNAVDIVSNNCSGLSGTDRSITFVRMMKEEVFTRFEETIDEFRERFASIWLL